MHHETELRRQQQKQLVLDIRESAIQVGLRETQCRFMQCADSDWIADVVFYRIHRLVFPGMGEPDTAD